MAETSETLSPPTEPATPSTITPIVPAGAWSRFWAFAIDSMYVGIISYVIYRLLSLITGIPVKNLNQIESSVEFSIIYLVIYLLYTVYLLVNKGATFGKDAYGFRVIQFNSDHNPSYPQALIRELIKVGVIAIPIIGSLLYLANGLVVVFSKQKRGIHDLIAKTQVTKTKKPWGLGKQLIAILLPIIVIIVLLTFSTIQQITHRTANQGEPAVQVPNSQVQNSTANLVDTTNWKTYQSDNGYSIKYPSSLYMQEDPQTKDITFSNQPIRDANKLSPQELDQAIKLEDKTSRLTISAGPSYNPNDLSTDVSQRFNPPEPQQKLKINNYDAISVEGVPGQVAGYVYNRTTYYYLSAKSGGIYAITKIIGSQDPDLDNIFITMLSSFTIL